MKYLHENHCINQLLLFKTFNAIFIFNIKEKSILEKFVLKKYNKDVKTGVNMLLKQVSMYRLVFPFQYLIHLILNVPIMNISALEMGIA